MTLPTAPPLQSVAAPSFSWPEARLRRPRATLVAALGLGVCAEVFLDGHALGISFPLLILLGLGVLLALGGREGWQRFRPNAWLLLPCLFFSVMVFVRASPLLTVLNTSATGVLLLLLTHFWAAGRVERLGLRDYPATLLDSARSAVRSARTVVRSEMTNLSLRGTATRLLPVARGAGLALPVLALFVMLLGSADGVFAEVMRRAMALVLRLFSWEVVEGYVYAGLGAFVALGVLAHALRRRRESEAGERESTVAVERFGFVESLTLVVLVDLIFLVFASLQFAFLWGGARLPSGVTYSSYARQGFFELLAVAAMTLGLSVVLDRWTRSGDRVRITAFRAACTAMVGLALVVLASAVNRMELYESIFGYTELRVYTHVFMGALAAVLLWRMVTLWWRPERFALGAFVGGLGFIVALDLLNPDAFIARRNLAATPAGGGARDIVYLPWLLSTDAAPELAAYLARHPTHPFPMRFNEILCAVQALDQGGWQSFHLARHRAAALVPPPEDCAERGIPTDW